VAPLFDRPRLIACPTCSVHIKRNEASCPACGAKLGLSTSLSTAALAPIILGLALAGCGDDASGGGTGSDTGTVPTSAGDDGVSLSGTSNGDAGSTDASGSNSMSDSVDTTFGGDSAAYGVPTTDDGFDTSGDSSGSDSGTTGGSGSSGTDDGSSTGGSTGGSTDGSTDDAGTTTGVDPETTGIEPAYGVVVTN